MATVTKLKAEVNNRNLPILGEDGKLYNYYVGRFTNKMLELGYTPASNEIAALNAFIENGINNDWLDIVEYLLPFIGTKTTPLTGLVPLIDKFADYELAESSIDESFFTYSGNKIIACGNTEATVAKANLPFSSADLPNKDFSPFINLNFTQDMVTPTLKGIHPLMETVNNEANRLATMIRYSVKSNKPIIQLGRIPTIDYPTSDPVLTDIGGTSPDTPCQKNIFYSTYHDSENIPHFKRYVMTKGFSSPDSIDLIGSVTNTDFILGQYILGSRVSQTTPIPFNIAAILNPLNVDRTKMDSFSAAVFALTTALGR